MTVLCSIPVQIPVHRIRVTAKCLATGGPVHTATLRLMDYWGESPEEIAEALGLRIPYVQTLIGQLEQGGEPVEREFVLWVDNARGRILPHTALTGVAVKPIRGGPHTFPVEWPLSADMLTPMGLQAGLSWDLGLEGYVEVLDVTEVLADIRNPSLPHLLRLPDTQLVIRSDATQTTSRTCRFAVTQHGVHDALLTKWVNTNYIKDLRDLVDNSDLLAAYTPPSHLNQITGDGQWQQLEPHPKQMRERVTDAADAARERLVLCAPDLRFIPNWIEQTLEHVAERDIEIVLCPSTAEHVPRDWHFDFTTTPISDQPPVLSLISDEDHAVIHTDPAACLDRDAPPVHQGLYATGQHAAIGRLLDKLNLGRLRRRPPVPKLTPQVIASMLRRELDKLRVELPQTVQANIQPQDEQFAIETLDRHPPREKPTKAAWKAAAGIAWERILIERVSHLSARHEQLTITAERWKPPNVRLDLDMIVHDSQKSVVWILDAKNSERSDDQLSKMRSQIRLLERNPELTHGCPTIIGVIVHRLGQLHSTPQQTEHHDILRCTLQGLADLLLAKRLPGERPQPRTRPKAA
jgi:hypothetical protein